MDDILKIVFAIGLVGHGAAHAVATANLVSQAAGSVKDGTLEVRSWLLPSLSPRAAALLALIFWLPASLLFIASAVSMLGLVLGDWPWSTLMVVAALDSTIGIVLFSGIWPGGEARLRVLHIFLAMAMNVIIFVTQLVLGWPAD